MRLGGDPLVRVGENSFVESIVPVSPLACLSSGRLQMDTKGPTSNNLPELPKDLVERIIMMMPFPSIFKARTLSKAWLARFTPIDPPEENRRVTSFRSLVVTLLKQLKRFSRSRVADLQKQVDAEHFQKQVLDRAANWPLFFSFNSQERFSAYELTSHTSWNLPSLSFLPKNIDPFCHKATGGALLFLYERPNLYGPRRERLIMANIFTQRYKVLAPRPKPPRLSEHEIHLLYLGEENYKIDPRHEQHETWLHHAHIVTGTSMQTYKLILLFEYLAKDGQRWEFCLETYDSKLNAWSSKKLGPIEPMNQVVHLNGVLYWTPKLMFRNVKLIALDCEEGIVSELTLPGAPDNRYVCSDGLVVCDSSLLMVLAEVPKGSIYCRQTRKFMNRKLMKIDLGVGKLWEIAGGPDLDSVMSSDWQGAVGHGACMYFIKRDGIPLTYNLPEDKWSCCDSCPNPSLVARPRVFQLGFHPCVCQPGVNLFMPI